MVSNNIQLYNGLYLWQDDDFVLEKRIKTICKKRKNMGDINDELQRRTVMKIMPEEKNVEIC